MFGVLLTMRWDVHRDHGNTFRAIEPSPKQILSAGRDANCKLRRDSDVCVVMRHERVRCNRCVSPVVRCNRRVSRLRRDSRHTQVALHLTDI